MMTGKQRAYLRRLAADLQPELLIGKEGLSENSFQSLDDLLRTRELVKVGLLRTAGMTAYEAADRLAERCAAEVVSVVGRKAVLYRFSPERAKKGKAIVFP